MRIYGEKNHDEVKSIEVILDSKEIIKKIWLNLEKETWEKVVNKIEEELPRIIEELTTEKQDYLTSIRNRFCALEALLGTLSSEIFKLEKEIDRLWHQDSVASDR